MSPSKDGLWAETLPLQTGYLCLFTTYCLHDTGLGSIPVVVPKWFTARVLEGMATKDLLKSVN